MTSIQRSQMKWSLNIIGTNINVTQTSLKVNNFSDRWVVERRLNQGGHGNSEAG